MARRSLDDAMDKYKSESAFFSLKNDKDTAVVRFLHEGDDLEFDEDWFVVHAIEIDGKKRWVRCPETSSCPGCRRKGKAQLKLFLQLIEKNDPDKRKVWERGQNFIPTVREQIKKYGDLCNRPYEIERNGVANSQNTTYELFALDRDDKRLTDIPVERQKLLDGKNGLVLDLTEDEIDDAIDGRLQLVEDRPDDRRSSGRDERSGRGDRGDRGRGERDSRSGSERGGRSDRTPAPSDRDAPPARRRGRVDDTDTF